MPQPGIRFFLICLTVVLGMVYNKSRHTHTNSRIDDLRSHVDTRFDDLKDFVKSEIRRVEEWQSPIHRA